MECNWPSFSVFLACSTQWRILVLTSGLMFVGIKYTDLKVVLEQHNAAPHVFADVQAMEDAALDILNEAD
ncbi:hypothetical protein AX761_23305 [Rhizobium sp. 58]|nr:hypothetical protein AX761_23305 [Rhizobium sp. 58]